MNKLDHHTIRMVESETMESVVQGLTLLEINLPPTRCNNNLYLNTEANHADGMRQIIRNEVSGIVLVMAKMRLKNDAPRITRKDAVVDQKILDRRIVVDGVDRKRNVVEVAQRNDDAVNQRNA